ncbi:MAG TPA: hypothetical protein VEU96_05175 [Bryobacteraceae bacterium]|nr:hypothetical protein [Bryobacteraceae bacterium]
MRNFLFVLAFTASSFCLFAQSALIFGRGVINAASFMPGGLPAGSIARGSLFSIFGRVLGPSSSPALAFPLSTTLGNVSISVTQGATTVAAIPVFVSPGQINAIMPSNAPLGQVTMRVVNGNFKTPPISVRVVTDSFGIFSVNPGGLGPGVMQNFVSASSTPVNTPTVAAQPGQTIILYGTGLGAGLNADNVAPQAGNLATKTEVFVGGQIAATQYTGRSPCCAGLDQIVFQVPQNAPLGCWVPVQIRTSGTTVSNTVTMAISSDGSPCTDSANALTTPFLAGQKIGLVALLRTDVNEDVGLKKTGNVKTDVAMMTFQQENPLPAAPFNAVISLPPAGACTAFTAAGDLLDGDSIPGSDPGAKFLSAGASFTLTGAAGNRTVRRTATNARNFQPLGFTYTGTQLKIGLFLDPGNFSLTGSGGSDVGQIQASVTLPNPTGLTWTNRDQTSIIDRSKGFTVNWAGAPADQPVIVFGGGVDVPTNSSAVFACVAPAGASSFTVPPVALGNLPATRLNLLQSKDAIYVGALPASNPTSFSASGIDIGAIMAGAFAGKTVIFQ